jgi:hypothetical protein
MRALAGDSLADEVGEEFDDVEAARGHAMAVARELSRNQLPDALDNRPPAGSRIRPDSDHAGVHGGEPAISAKICLRTKSSFASSTCWHADLSSGAEVK